MRKQVKYIFSYLHFINYVVSVLFDHLYYHAFYDPGFLKSEDNKTEYCELNGKSPHDVTTSTAFLSPGHEARFQDRTYMVKLLIKRVITILIFVGILIAGVFCHIFIDINDENHRDISNTTAQAVLSELLGH